jgi:ParB family transcriptional regulator, chromosome partitioning protein
LRDGAPCRSQGLASLDRPRHDVHMPPWNKSTNLQLDLLDAAAIADEVSPQSNATSTAAGQPLMLALTSLYADPNNPRTEVPEAELDELTDDIRERGVLQPIVVSAPDEDGRYCIQFGSKRWRASMQAGLIEVPVMLATRAHDAYDQVAENLKRHSLSPIDLAKFIRGRVDAGDSNATIAKHLAIDQTTVAHHLALLNLPPVLDAALKTGRCASPRTLYELNKLHAGQPERVAELVNGREPITRDAVAEIRDTAPLATASKRASVPTPPRPERTAHVLARATGLCEQLDAALLRLTRSGMASLPPDGLAALRQRIVALAGRIGA